MKNVLGRVAGVAKGVFQELNAAEPEDDEELEALLQQISDSRHAGERREAMGRLKDLLVDNPRAQASMGSMGLPVLLAVLQEDRDDVELVRGALEALLHTFADSGAAQAPVPAMVPAPPGVMNAQLFARSSEHSALLLSLLEDEPVGISDFYVRYHTLQLLTALLQASPHKLQEAILSSPLGVVRLMDCLADREVIRNEALLLLVALTRTNGEVQKIAAFEGAFERALGVVREEGGCGGGAVVVADALALLSNLLRGNLANQRLFREMGHISQLPPLLAYTPPPQSQHEAALMAAAGAAATAAATAAGGNFGGALGGSSGMSGMPGSVLQPQVAANLLGALKAARLLLAAAHAATAEDKQREAANRSANQAKLMQLGLMGQLLGLALEEGGLPSAAVRAQALFCLKDLVASCQPNQNALSAATVRQRGRPLPALHAALRVALHSGDAMESVAGAHVLAAFCGGNADGQVALLSTIAPSGGSSNASDGTFGEELAHALVGSTGSTMGGVAGLAVSARAAGVLQHLLEGNDACKQRLLGVPFDARSNETLLPRCVRYLGEALRAGPGGKLAAIVLLKLLITWLHGCPAAVDVILRGPSHLPLLVDGAGGRLCNGDVDVAGLCAVLLGVCFLYAPKPPQPPHLPPHHLPPPPPTTATSSSNSPAAQMVLDVILSRVGISQFCGRIEDMIRGRLFAAAKEPARAAGPSADATEAAGASAHMAGHNGVVTGRGGYSSTGASPTHCGRNVNGHADDELNPYDLRFTELVEQVEAAVKLQTLDAFSNGSSASSSGRPGGLGPPQAVGAVTVEQLAAQLPGAAPGEKLGAALAAMLRLQQEVAELQQRNRALAQDLIHVSSSAGAGTSGTGPAQQQGQQGGGGGSADADARMAAQLRASRAEMEVGTLKQQLAAMGQRWSELETQAAAASAAEEEARAAAHKAEQDLADLSGAYNSLEAHSHQLEAQLRGLQQQQQQHGQQHGAGEADGVGASVQQQGDVAAQIAVAAVEAQAEAAGKLRALEEQHSRQTREAVEQALAQERAKHSQGASTPAAMPPPGTLSEAEVAARVEAAAAEARAAAEADAEEQLTDLLVCLGQEESKVAALSERLAAYGVDVEGLLAAVAEQEADEGDDEVT